MIFNFPRGGIPMIMVNKVKSTEQINMREGKNEWKNTHGHHIHMAELCVSSQSSFLLRPKIEILHNPRTAISLSLSGGGAQRLQFGASSSDQARSLKLGAVSHPSAPNLFTVDSGTKGIVIEPEIGGGDGGEFGRRDSGGGGGGGGGGGDNSNDRGEEGPDDSSKKKGMSMSQKLTLAYAVLVGGKSTGFASILVCKNCIYF